MQHVEGVARAVAKRQYHMVGPKGLPRLKRHAANMTTLDDEVFDTTLEANLPPKATKSAPNF
jgi:hypothetical protein